VKDGVTLEEVNDLREFGNKLLGCKSITEVVDATFTRIEQKLTPQVVSLFLFSKDGTLKKFKTRGLDTSGFQVESSWFLSEQYLPGESFSGRAAAPRDSSSSGFPYGEPYCINTLDLEYSKFKHGREYFQKFGFLKSGVSVPLNGTHRTFGTIEALNRKKPDNSIDRDGIYLESEVCWLTLVGAHVSAAISRIRRQEESNIYTNISRKLADPDDNKIESTEVYNSIAEQFIDSLTPYKVCILRVAHGENLYVVERSCSQDISFAGKGQEPRPIRGCFVGEAYTTQKPIIIEDVLSEIDRFHSSLWIRQQRLQSFIGFPLVIQGEAVGTISLFTGYIHEFTENDLSFLENISYLLAAYIVGIKRAVDVKVPTFSWEGKEIKDLAPIENRVLLAFQDPKWDFRTTHGIADELEIRESRVIDVKNKYLGRYIRESLVPGKQGRSLYTLKDRPIRRREKLSWLRLLISKSISRK